MDQDPVAALRSFQAGYRAGLNHYGADGPEAPCDPWDWQRGFEDGVADWVTRRFWNAEEATALRVRS